MTLDAEIVGKVMGEIDKMPMKNVLEDLKLLQPTEVAPMLGIGRSTVYALYNVGELPGFKVGGRLRFRPRALMAYVMLKEMVCKPQEREPVAA